MEQFDAVWINGHVATLDDRGAARDGYGAIEDAALATRSGTIAWVGPRRDLPAARVSVEYDMDGGWLLPGLIDCHTHLVFAGNRALEFERRLAGVSYEEIARSGGGIRSTVRDTRQASRAELLHSATGRAWHLLKEGVTTLEVKSGYGLDQATELRMLRVARDLEGELPASIRATFLGPHALPPEFDSRGDAYVAHLVEDVLPLVTAEGLADQVDAFLEHIAFNESQCLRFLSAGKAAGLGVRLHADQLSDGNGAALAARLGARSADHLEHSSKAGIRAMAKAGTVAVLLPCAFYVLGQGRAPDIPAMREAGVRMAVASDLNPGSAPVRSLLLALNMACVMFGLTPSEALAGATRHAAAVLDCGDRGELRLGLRADLSHWAVNHPRELCYWVGGSQCRASWVQGQQVIRPPETAPHDTR